MHRKASMLCMLAALLSFGSVAFAQEQTVSIQGVVKDASGAVLPGATVEARNPLGRWRQHGGHRMPMASTASRRSRPATYEVSVDTAGLQARQAQRTPSSTLGRKLVDRSDDGAGRRHRGGVGHRRVVADHRHQEQRHLRVDSAEAPSSACPRGATFTTILRRRRAPRHESKSGGIQIDGASGSENRFIIDGMDTTNLQTGVVGQDDAARLRRRSAGQVVRLQRRVRRRHRRRRQRADQVGQQRVPRPGRHVLPERRTCTAAPAAGARFNPIDTQPRRDGDDHAR